MKQEINLATHNVKIAICHGAAPQKAESLLQPIREEFSGIKCITSDFGPTVGAHTGPGAVGVSWITHPK